MVRGSITPPKRAGKHQLLGNLESLVKMQLSCSKSVIGKCLSGGSPRLRDNHVGQRTASFRMDFGRNVVSATRSRVPTGITAAILSTDNGASERV